MVPVADGDAVGVKAFRARHILVWFLWVMKTGGARLQKNGLCALGKPGCLQLEMVEWG